jgi:hypothetical protein
MKYSESILEVQSAFEIASKNNLEVVKNMQTHKEIIKAERLRKLGLICAKQSELKEDKKLTDEIGVLEAEKIVYYQIKYPGKKFIRTNQVKIICEKYNLVFTDIWRYKGFVPEKNLQEIENFKIDSEDQDSEIASRHLKEFNGIPEDKIIIDGGISAKKRGYHFATTVEIPALLKICAPEIDLTVNSRFIWKGELCYDYPDLSKINNVQNSIPDPIVLQPVKYGFFIVTAWGDEASDELVINHILN